MVDLETLLAPISEESPSGVDLRDQPADLTFQTLVDERREVAPEEDPAGTGHQPNWAAVVGTCTEALTGSTKDLELSAWLTEGLTRTQGFEGLRAGLDATSALLRTFWDTLHPGADPDGDVVLPVRARPLSWLGSSRDMLRAVATCPILVGADGRALGWDDYRNAQLVDEKATLADKSQYEELIAAGYLTGEEWNSRLASASAGDLRQVIEQVSACEEALQELRKLAEERFGADDAPSFVGLGELLLELREYLAARAAPAGVEAGVEAAASVQMEGAGPATASAGAIGSREDALRRLQEVADYFRRAEPHSPISYLVERAARWGHMPLLDVLREFVEDPNALTRIRDNLGIQGDDTSE